jgi:hypothetical protein
MTKAIKFNLLLDKHPVRDLDDLRANFNLDDLLTAYHSHTLHRWLEVRGLTAELKQLNAIESTDELSIASALCELFQENISDTDIETAVYPFEFRQQQQQQLKELNSQKFEKNAVIKSYHAGYEKLCAEMLEKAEDYPFLKAAVNTLWIDYTKLFRVDFNRFFDEFIEKSPLTLFTMLANDDYQQSGIFKPKRKEIIFSSIPQLIEIREKVIEKEGKRIEFKKDTNYNWEKVTNEKVIVKKVNNSSNKVILKDNYGKEYQGQKGIGRVFDGLHFYSYSSEDSVEYALFVKEKVKEYVKSKVPLPDYYQSFSGVTEGYWKDLQPKGTKCLILGMEAGNFIRNSGKNGEELNADAINKQFLILDGIDYKSNNANHALTYMVI